MSTVETHTSAVHARRWLLAIVALTLLTTACSGRSAEDEANASKEASPESIPMVDSSAAKENSSTSNSSTANSSSNSSASSSSTSGQSTTTATSQASTSSSTSQASSSSSSTPTTAQSTSTTAATSTTVAGTPFDIGPPAGQAMQVVGVAYDDVLNFRTAPDPSATLVDTAAPFSTSPTVQSKGSGVLVGNSSWWHVTVDGVDAWANFSFLGSLTGTTTSIYSQLLTDMPAVNAPDIETLAQNVGNVRSGGPTPTVVFSAEPEAVDAQGGQAVIDVMGLGDDAAKGERIWLSYSFVWDDPNGPNPTLIEVALTDATMMPICARGLTGTSCT